MDFHNDRTRLSLKALQMLPQMYGRDCRAVRWAFAYRACAMRCGGGGAGACCPV